MNYKALSFVIVATALAIVGVPGSSNAQPGSQPFFYGEEPWGGSYLGVDTQDVTTDRLGVLHLKDERGVEITMVDQDAPAGKAGLKEHDVILSINDQQVQSVEQLRRLIREVPPGRVISIGISRGGQPMTVRAQLAERDKMPNFDFHYNPVINVPAVHIPPINVPEIDVPNIVVVHAPRSSGMMIENLTPQLGDFFGAKGGNGVLVRSVEKGSRAEQAGLRAGDVIVKVNGAAVNDCSDFSRLLRSRSAAKASVTVLRDRKEQNLTLNLPDSKRTGSLYNTCREHASESNCVEIEDGSAEVAAMLPAITADIKRYQPDLEKLRKQVEEEVKRQRPELEKMTKELQKELNSNQGELKKEMEQLQKGLEKQSEEMREEWRQFQKKASEI